MCKLSYKGFTACYLDSSTICFFCLGSIKPRNPTGVHPLTYGKVRQSNPSFAFSSYTPICLKSNPQSLQSESILRMLVLFPSPFSTNQGSVSYSHKPFLLVFTHHLCRPSSSDLFPLFLFMCKILFYLLLLLCITYAWILRRELYGFSYRSWIFFSFPFSCKSNLN